MAPRTKPGATNARTAKTSDSPATKPQQQAAQPPAQPAQVKPASDPTPAGANTQGKVLPETAPAPKSTLQKIIDSLVADWQEARRQKEAKNAGKTQAQINRESMAELIDMAPIGGRGLSGGLGRGLKGGAKPNAPRNTGASPAPAPASKPTATPAPPPPPAPPAPPPPAGPQPADGSGGGYSLGGGKADCGIKPYKDLKGKCPKGQQAHHIVPDYTLRYGTRTDAGKRIPGMPSQGDGPAICVSGNARSPGSDHNKAHEGTDPRIADAGKKTNNGPDGNATMGEIIDISIEEVSKVKPHCADEIKKKTEDAFKNVDRNKYGRTTQQPPEPGTDAHGSLKRGESHQLPGRGRGRR